MSDYDIAIVSDDLFKAAKDKKIPLGQDITGPGGPRPTPDATRALLPADLKALGLELTAKGLFDLGALVTHRYTLDEVDRAYSDLQQKPPGFIKAVVRP